MSRNVMLKEKKLPGKGKIEANFENTAFLSLVNEVEENETTKE